MIEFLTADTSSTASLLVTFLPMVLILVFMYIILYLPQKKQDKKDAAMRASIEVGDTVRKNETGKNSPHRHAGTGCRFDKFQRECSMGKNLCGQSEKQDGGTHAAAETFDQQPR